MVRYLEPRRNLVPSCCGGLPRLTLRLGTRLDLCTSEPSSFHEVTIPYRMNSCLLRRDDVLKAMRFASILVEAEPSLGNSGGRERAWLDHYTHISGLIYEPPPEIGLKLEMAPRRYSVSGASYAYH